MKLRVDQDNVRCPGNIRSVHFVDRREGPSDTRVPSIIASLDMWPHGAGELVLVLNIDKRSLGMVPIKGIDGADPGKMSTKNSRQACQKVQIHLPLWQRKGLLQACSRF